SVEGWPLLAKLMTEKPDFEAFPRYSELNIKNLLYYQVELASIKSNLERIEHDDFATSAEEAVDNEHEFHKWAETLINTQTDQWDEVKKLRRCLKEYNEALLQYGQVSALPSPSRGNMKQLLWWLVSPAAGNFKVAGSGSEVWGNMFEDPGDGPSPARQFLNLVISIFRTSSTPSTRHDLVAPRGRKSVDGMTRWLAEEAIPFWFNLTAKNKGEEANKSSGRDEEKAAQAEHDERARAQAEANQKEELRDLKLDYIKSYSGLTILRLTSHFTTLFACMLPMAAIGILSTVEELSHRLALIAGFTAVFCGGLMMLTEITRVQVFTATSAFLAVLVVFV
ncbi:putative isoleucyl-tRNA synthetase, partial [Cladorrhinum sp. PSN259]